MKVNQLLTWLIGGFLVLGLTLWALTHIAALITAAADIEVLIGILFLCCLIIAVVNIIHYSVKKIKKQIQNNKHEQRNKATVRSLNDFIDLDS